MGNNNSNSSETPRKCRKSSKNQPSTNVAVSPKPTSSSSAIPIGRTNSNGRLDLPRSRTSSFDYSNVHAWSVETVSQWAEHVFTPNVAANFISTTTETTSPSTLVPAANELEHSGEISSALAHEKIKQKIKEFDITGKKLLELSETDLEQMFDVSNEQSKLMMTQGPRSIRSSSLSPSPSPISATMMMAHHDIFDQHTTTTTTTNRTQSFSPVISRSYSDLAPSIRRDSLSKTVTASTTTMTTTDILSTSSGMGNDSDNDDEVAIFVEDILSSISPSTPTETFIPISQSTPTHATHRRSVSQHEMASKSCGVKQEIEQRRIKAKKATRLTKSFRSNSCEAKKESEDNSLGSRSSELNEKNTLVVLNKLEAIPALKNIAKPTDFSAMLNGWELLRQYASNLAVPTQMLESFLSKKTNETIQAISTLVDVYGCNEITRKELMRAQAAAFDASRAYWKNFEDYNGEIKIRLLIVEQSNQVSIESVCPVRYRMINTNPSEQKKLHEPTKFITAITIGPFYLEWNESNLIIPQKCCSKAIVYSEELGKVVSRKMIDGALSQVASFVTTWNHGRLYSELTCNCYHFVSELLTELNVMKPVSGRLFENFMIQIESQGSAEMCFTNPQKQYVGMNSSRATSSYSDKQSECLSTPTHRELDEFLWHNLQYLESDDIMMFKCIDTAIYANWNSFRCLEHRPSDCFFGDPERLTQSISQINIVKSQSN